MTDRIGNALSLMPERLGWHLLLTSVALTLGILISIPTAIFASRRPAMRGPLLALAGVIQTIPSLALLALLVVLLSAIGFWPAIIALTLYSILPILRNTVTGITGVDPSMIEAARGVGMTPRQMLCQVQLPLAAPVIIAGIRTATVWVVGIATLSTPVGQPSLGNYIFQGLQLRNNVLTIVGVIAAAGLAILLDFLIGLMQKSSERRSKPMFFSAVGALLLVVSAGLYPIVATNTAQITIGAKTFTEQYILTDLIRMKLGEAEITARKKQGMGTSILFDALANSTVDVYVDYSGTIWSNVMKRTDIIPREEMLDEITIHLKNEYDITCLGSLGFENTYALAMRRDRAEQLGVKTIDQLAHIAGEMTVGGDYEFFGRPEWTKLRETYDLTFQKRVSLDSTLMYQAVRDGQVDVISAFSTDGRIAAYDLVVLQDPRQAFPPYDALILVSPEASGNKTLTDALRPLLGSIDADAMRNANKAVDLDGETPRSAALLLLK